MLELCIIKGEAFGLDFDLPVYGLGCAYILFEDREWKEGKIVMSAQNIEVNIHPHVKYCDKNLGPPPEERWFSGSCGFILNPLSGLYELETKWFEFESPIATTYVRGHEEGHAREFLGQLEGLYSILQNQGYVFDVLSLELARELDAQAISILDAKQVRNNEEFSKLRSAYLTSEESEIIANMGGLQALLEAKIDEKIIDVVVRAIEKSEVFPAYLRKALGFC